MLQMPLFNFKLIKQEKGGLAVIFAIILPFIFSVCALVFDGSRMLMKRARLSDALNEAALVVATNSAGKGTEEERKRNADLLKSYISAYFPKDELESSSVTMRSGIDSASGMPVPIYDLNAQLKVNTVLPLGSIVPAFSPQVGLTNGGSVRKGISDISLPADYVFVVDFSGSMGGYSDHPDENGKQQTRIALLKKVVDDVTSKALKNEPKTTFGIVPFETGVPVLRANPQPGEEFGCELVMVPKPSYDINFEYWGRMMPALHSNDALARRIYLHHHRYSVHINDIMRQMGYTSMASFSADTGICEPIDELVLHDASYRNLNSDPNFPVPYVCDFLNKNDAGLRYVKDPRGIEANIPIINEEYNLFANITPPTNLMGTGGYVFNASTVDVNATIEGVFDKANLKSWSIPKMLYHHKYINPTTSAKVDQTRGGPFYATCTSARANPIGGLQRNYLIELTSDSNKLKPFVDTMLPTGNTISTTGVLRGAQVLAKGTNPRKVMIIISDGEDNSPSFKDQFHRSRPAGKRLCDVIRDKMPDNSINTEQVEIYFISVVGSLSDVTRAKYWEDYCTGPGNSFVANNYKDLMDRLTSIVSAYEETGYFNNRDS
jgi:tight adherence protein G